MARYQPAPDLWDPATREALDAGTLKLQPGQWFRCGPRCGALSRFYRHTPGGSVLAFHGPRGQATRQMRAYLASGRRVAL